MRRFLAWAAVALAGCAATGGGVQTPCEKCDYGYVIPRQAQRAAQMVQHDRRQADLLHQGR